MSTVAANRYPELCDGVEACRCYHCGLPVPKDINLSTKIDGENRAMCCHGCMAVAEAIISGGYGHYYQSRTALPDRAEDVVPHFLRTSSVYDNPALLDKYARTRDGSRHEVSLMIEGITCAACIWLIERHLKRQTGVESISVNYTTHCAQLVWSDKYTALSTVIDALRAIGYNANLYKPEKLQQHLTESYRQSLRRMVVAGIFGMQIMMLAIALYLAGDDIDARYQQLFRWVSLLLSVPVMVYSARTFFSAALGQITARALGMDVPVSLGIGIAFFASVIATVIGEGEIYFDSAAMFTFLLLLARHAELCTRIKANNAASRWHQAIPEFAQRLEVDGSYQQITAIELCIGNQLRVLPGQVVPVDGILLEGSVEVDESLLTGEAFPVVKNTGDTLMSGAVVLDQVVFMEVSATSQNSFSAHVSRLLERGQCEKPKQVELASQVAGYFVSTVLLLAVCVALFWWNADPSQWLAITLATLIVTCPCALSLATPTAVTAASNALSTKGMLVTRGHAIETMPQVTHVVFDKTGTLTENTLALANLHIFPGYEKDKVLLYAAALSQHSQHPVAMALTRCVDASDILTVGKIRTATGGISGTFGRQLWHFGSREYLLHETGVSLPAPAQAKQDTQSISILMCDGQPVGVFYFSQCLRAGAKTLIAELKALGKKVTLLSGDNEAAVARIARDAGIEKYHAHSSPEQKLAIIQALQKHGGIVAMVGDGGNDSPALAAADLSIAMSAGADLARNSADVILLSDNLSAIVHSLRCTMKTKRVIRQNIAWAIAYNLFALPFAAAGVIAPWMAAIGMSASSLFVVLNATRLNG